MKQSSLILLLIFVLVACGTHGNKYDTKSNNKILATEITIITPDTPEPAENNVISRANYYEELVRICKDPNGCRKWCPPGESCGYDGKGEWAEFGKSYTFDAIPCTGTGECVLDRGEH